MTLVPLPVGPASPLFVALRHGGSGHGRRTTSAFVCCSAAQRDRFETGERAQALVPIRVSGAPRAGRQTRWVANMILRGPHSSSPHKKIHAPWQLHGIYPGHDQAQTRRFVARVHGLQENVAQRTLSYSRPRRKKRVTA